ncbi:MAG: amino acid permease [Caldilineae bacterium]|nr:MAG: amino acid permease [Caldilineae bacterium]
MPTHQPSSQRFQISLSRDLGLFDVTMIGVGAMIGAGIFGLTGIAAGEAGPVGLLLAFFLNGILTSLTGLTYAELGAAYPQAGGGYAWVKEGLARIYGFYAGWISWFSHSVACSLYAVLFGTFFVELMEMAGLHLGQNPVLVGFSQEQLAVKAVAVLAALTFILINVRGSSETGLVGNIITIFKILVLGMLVVFGLRALANIPNWSDNFLHDPGPLPHGIRGVILAMGLTFVAFEGYEIIAQSGEEVKDPDHNLPRAIFLAIAIVVAIYLAVAFVTVGAVQQDTGLPNWVYLGDNAERAMIETARIIMPYGALIMILGGLASTTSALNATIYSSSRVSYAMGRDRDLPAIFGRVHTRNKTPHWAIWLSGLLIMGMAVFLPVADVASGASITFLLLFLMVNIALIRMRKTHPDLRRPFRAPLVPYLQYFSIAAQLVLAVELFQLSPIAWIVTIVWLALGLLVYSRHGAVQEAAKYEDIVLLEESVSTSEYSVLLPVANEAMANHLARLGSLFAQANQGELFALHVIAVPQQIGITDGRAFLRRGRPLLEEVIDIGREHDVPVRTMLRLGRDVGQSIMDVAREREVNLMILGWPGHAAHRQEAFGSVIDLMSKNPPADLAVVRFRHSHLPRRILVPVAGGPNSRLAIELAVTESDSIVQRSGRRPEIIVLNLLLDHEEGEALEKRIAERREQLLEELGFADWPVDLKIRPARDIVSAILEEAEDCDQIIIGASEEGLLEQSLFGSIPQQVAEEALCTVIMAKRHDPVRFGLRRWLLGRPRRRKQPVRSGRTTS